MRCAKYRSGQKFLLRMRGGEKVKECDEIAERSFEVKARDGKMG